MSGSGGGSTDTYQEIETALKSVLGDANPGPDLAQQQMQQQNLTMTTPGSSSPWIRKQCQPYTSSPVT